MVIGWPVAERASSRRKTPRSSARGMIFSMPMQAMCSGGSDMPRSALPSLVQTTKPPVSATAKFTPVRPASALQELLAQVAAGRLGQVLGVGGALRRCPACSWKSSPISSFFRWMAGRTMWLGGSSRQLHDPLAEVGVDHLDAAGLEVRIEAALLGEHRLALHHPGDAARRQDAEDDRVVLGGVAGPVDLAPAAVAFRSNCSRVVGQARQRVGLDRRAQLAQRLPLRHRRRRPGRA